MYFLHHWKLQLSNKTLLILLLCFLFALNFPVASLAAQVSKVNENPRVSALLYHHIVPELLPDSPPNAAIIPLSEFEEQMEYLFKHGYHTATLKEVEDFLYTKKKLPERTVVITFDDGYESNYIYAFPVLKKYGYKAAIFVIGNETIEAKNQYDPKILSKLTFDQIKEMTDSGLVEFGNHTFDAHNFIDKKAALLSMNQEQTLQDFLKVKELFDMLGLPEPRGIAYPFGQFNDNSIVAAKTAGLKLGFTVKSGSINQDSPPLTLNRIIVPPNTTQEKFKALLKDNSPVLPKGFEDSVLLYPGSDTAYVLGKPLLINSAPIIVNGVVMAPLDFFTKQLGWDVIWDPILYQVATRVTFDNKAWFSFTAYPVDGKVMVPVKPLAGVMGYEVKWHQEEKMVELKKP